MRSFLGTFCVLGFAVWASGCQETVRQADEWDVLFHREKAHGWSGGDAAYSVPLPGERTLWLFGDTILAGVEDDRRIENELRFGNTVAVQGHSAATSPASNADMLFDWGAASSTGWMPVFDRTLQDPEIPTSLRRALHLGHVPIAWPLHGIVIGNDLLLFNALVTPASCDGCSSLGFEVHGSMASVVQGVNLPYSEWGFESGVGWRPERRPQQAYLGLKASDTSEDTSVLWGTYVIPDAENARDLLVYGHRQAGQEAGLVVAKIENATSAADALDASNYRFWDGSQWADDENAAATILSNAAVEVSVLPVPASQEARWAVVHSGYDIDAKIRVAVADSPTGPFDERYVFSLADCPIGGFDSTLAPYAYAAKAHPHLSTDEDILVSLVLAAAGDPRVDHAHDVRYYTPRFLYLPWSEVLDHDRSSGDRCDMSSSDSN